MAKYRTRPVVIDAWKWEPGVRPDGAEIWWHRETKPGAPVRATLRTREGDMAFTTGDYVVKGVAGEFSAVRRDLFEATYDPVDGEE